MYFAVQKVKGKIGESVDIFWNVPSFPRTGTYTINNRDKNNDILKIDDKIIYNTSSKYEYLSIPFNSTSIKFRISNLTLDDAGYYTGGADSRSQCLECSVVVIVHGKGTFLQFYCLASSQYQIYIRFTIGMIRNSAEHWNINHSNHLKVFQISGPGGTLRCFMHSSLQRNILIYIKESKVQYGKNYFTFVELKKTVM